MSEAGYVGQVVLEDHDPEADKHRNASGDNRGLPGENCRVFPRRDLHCKIPEQEQWYD